MSPLNRSVEVATGTLRPESVNGRYFTCRLSAGASLGQLVRLVNHQTQVQDRPSKLARRLTKEAGRATHRRC